MTLQQLGEKLHTMYFESNDGEAVVMIHLFGIKYSEAIRASGASMKSIAITAGINKSYATEISKGVKLSKFVRLN
jgi:hypothetical protein